MAQRRTISQNETTFVGVHSAIAFEPVPTDRPGRVKELGKAVLAAIVVPPVGVRAKLPQRRGGDLF